jgi:hypothetical protein
MSRPIQFCFVDGCGERRVGRGMCRMHYMRWKRNGDPLSTPRFCSLEDRFWGYVLAGHNGCWEWSGGTHRGYGAFVVSQKPTVTAGAHRFAYELLVGKIPDGLTLDHLCRNKKCVNPLHLEPVTMRVNVLRNSGPSAINAAKTHCQHGHPFDEQNTYVYSSGPRCGARKCRECERLRMQRYRASRSSR